MTKLIEITGKALSGEWGSDDANGIGIPVLRTTNFTNEGIVNYQNVVTRIITKQNISEKYLRPGDIIIEKSGGSDKQPVGRVIYYDGPENTYLFNNFTGLLRVKDPSQWHPKYVFYALFSNYCRGGTLSFENKTTGLYNLKVDDYVSCFEIQEAPLDKQISICRTLDSVRSLIGSRKQQIVELDNLIKARFVEMFGVFDLSTQSSEWIPISHIGTVITGATPKTSVSDYWDGDLNWITPAELRPLSGYIYESERKITQKGAMSCSIKEMPRGTVILSSRAPIGKVAILGVPMYCNQGFKNIVCNDAVLPEYLYYLLGYNSKFLNSLGRGATFKEISRQIVENIRIPVPEMSKQVIFREFVGQVDKSKLAVRQSLEKTQQLYDSLMQEYFG